MSYPRMKFLLECLKDLDESLKKYGGRLYVVKGPSDVVVKQLIEVICNLFDKLWKHSLFRLDKVVMVKS